VHQLVIKLLKVQDVASSSKIQDKIKRTFWTSTEECWRDQISCYTPSQYIQTR